MGREIATTLMIASSNFSFVVLAAQIPERGQNFFSQLPKKRRPSSRMKKKNTLNEKRPIQRHQTSSRPFQDISAYPISERGNLKVKKMTGRYSGHNIVTSEDFSSGLSATSDPTRFFFQLKDDDTSCLDTVLSSRVTRQG